MLLIVILILVTVMTFVSIARAVFSKGVTSQVLRSSLGIQAQTLAESAAEEALVQLRSRVNDPDDLVYLAFRGEVYADEPGQFPVSIEMPRFQKLLEENPEMGSFYVDEQGAVVEFQRQFSSVPYERYGLVKVAARVSTDLGFSDSVTRRVELGVEFKTHLLSTPRPFDQTAIYVQDAADLLAEPYRRLEEAIQAIEDVRAEHDEMVGAIDSRKDSLPFNGQAMLSRYEGLRIPPRDYWRNKAPEFRPPAAAFSLGRDPAGVDLRELDVKRKTETAWDAVLRTEKHYRDARSRVQSSFENPSRHDDYLDKLRILLGAYSELFGVMDRFRSQFHVYDGEKYAELGMFGYKLGRDEWRRKVTFDLDRDPDGRGPDEVLTELLANRSRRLYGVYYTNWPGKVVTLKNLDVAGRVVLVAEATKVVVENLNLGATDRDLFTIVSFGDLEVHGQNQCSFLAGGNLISDPETKIKGNLVFDKVPEAEKLVGRVAFEEKFYSGRTTKSDARGAFEDYYFVTLAPRPVYRSIERN